MAEAFSSPSSCIEDRSGIFSSVFLSPPACPACVVPGCWARGGCTAVTQLCSGKAQGAAELSLPLHPPGLWHCLSFPTWNFPVHCGFYCPESAVTTGQLQGLLLCSPLVKKISLVKKKKKEVVNLHLKTNTRFAKGFLSTAVEMLFILMW